MYVDVEASDRRMVLEQAQPKRLCTRDHRGTPFCWNTVRGCKAVKRMVTVYHRVLYERMPYIDAVGRRESGERGGFLIARRPASRTTSQGLDVHTTLRQIASIVHVP